MAASKQDRASTGIAGLDDVLHGGLIRGRLYLLDGNPGAGKTTLALQFLLEGVRAGEKCLYVTLSETSEELAEGARSHGWDLSGIEIHELIAQHEDLDGQNQLTMFSPAEVELTETTRRILDAINRVRPARMVLDSLSELRLLAQSSLRYRRQILALKQFFVGKNSTVLLLDDRTAEGSDLQLQSIAHGVLSLDHKAPAYGQSQRQLQVIKFRGSDFRSGFHDFAIRRGGPRDLSSPRGGGAPGRFRADLDRERRRRARCLARRRHRSRHDDPADRAAGNGQVDGRDPVCVRRRRARRARGGLRVRRIARDPALPLQGLGIPIVQGHGAGQIMVRQIDPAEIAPGEFAQLIRESVERDRASVVVIDSLNGYLNAMPEAQFLTAQLHELLSYLNNHGVATFLVVAQSGLMGPAMHSPVDASYLADAVVMMRMYEHAGSVKKAISVVKKRSGRHEQSIRQIWFDEAGLHLSEPLMHLRGVLAGVPVELGDSAHVPAAVSIGNGD
jgi:circadian clock protein KaiC